MASNENKKWSDVTDVHLLVHIVIKCGPVIPYDDIAAEFGTSTAAVRSKVMRLKQKYKSGGSDGSAPGGNGEDDDNEEDIVVPKKRKRAVKAATGTKGAKKIKAEEKTEEDAAEEGKDED